VFPDLLSGKTHTSGNATQAATDMVHYHDPGEDSMSARVFVAIRQRTRGIDARPIAFATRRVTVSMLPAYLTQGSERLRKLSRPAANLLDTIGDCAGLYPKNS
jgi:hypothetical protein